MALTVGGRRGRSRAGLRLAGATPAAPTARGTTTTWPTGVEHDKLDANVVRLRRHRRVAPLAAHRRRGLPRDACGPWSSRPSTSCSTCRRRAARSSGPATPTARRGPSRCSPARRPSATRLRCAVRRGRGARPRATRLGAGRGRLADVIADAARAPSRPRTAGPWTGTTRCCRARSPATPAEPAWPSAATRSSMDGLGVRCVGDRPGSPRPRRASAPSPTSPPATTSTARELLRLHAAAPPRRRPLLDRHRVPRGRALPRRRAHHLHGRRRDPRRRRPAARRLPGRPTSPPRRRPLPRRRPRLDRIGDRASLEPADQAARREHAQRTGRATPRRTRRTRGAGR